MTWDAFNAAPPPGMPWGVNFGGGVNSTALLLFCWDFGIRPDWVVFSDTGSERPETYENVERVKAWCNRVGFPFDTTSWIRRDGSFESVHANALRTGYLPSKAYGYSGCTYKWKIQPLQKWRKLHGFSPSGVAVGYDAGETRRLTKAMKRVCESMEQDADETVWYPLAAWGYDRNSCVLRIREEGWPPAKSACFLCPNMKPTEWDSLKTEHPNLFNIAKNVQEFAEMMGNAQTVNLFRSYNPNAEGCICTADGCLTRSDEDLT